MDGILTSYPSSVLELRGSSLESRLSSKVQLCNLTTENRLAFKVKSNAPKGSLVVRPNLGILPPKQVLDVSITVHRQGKEHRKNYKLKIQFVILTEGEADLDWIWRTSPFDKIYDRKMDVHVSFRQESTGKTSALVDLKNTHLTSLNDLRTPGSESRRNDLDDILSEFSSIAPNQVYVIILIFVIGFITGKWIF